METNPSLLWWVLCGGWTSSIPHLVLPSKYLLSHLEHKYSVHQSCQMRSQRAHVAILSHTVVSSKAIPLGSAHPGTWELTLHC